MGDEPIPVPPVLPPVLPPLLATQAAWPPSLARALAMLGIYVGFMMVLGSLFSVIDMVTHGLMGAIVAQSAGMVIAAVGTLLVARPVLALDWRTAIRRAGGCVPRGAWLPVIVLFAVGYPLVVQISLFTHQLLPMPDFLARIFDELFGDEDEVFSALVLLVLIAPLTEEFVCRGWLLPAALGQWRAAKAIAFTALVFALMHLNPWQFFYALYLGSWLGWVYVRTRSVWPCVAGHGVNNGLAWLSSLNIQETTTDASSVTDLPESLPWPVIGLSLLAVIACAAWLFRATAIGRTSSPGLNPDPFAHDSASGC